MDDDLPSWLIRLALCILASGFVVFLSAVLFYGLHDSLATGGRSIVEMRPRAVIEVIVVVIVVGMAVLILADA